MRFRNPCKKCLVRPACTVTCGMSYQYIKTTAIISEVVPSVIIIVTIAMYLSWVWG
jgi:hypothetical protein